jgi:ribosomal protein S18 acetylase RimI-like enzyme
MSLQPPDGFRVRHVYRDDVSAINALVVAADEAVMGWSDSTETDLLDWWRMVDLEQDSWLVENESLAAYGVLYAHGDSAELDGYVEPGSKGNGLGRWLLERGQERGRERGLPKAQTWCLAQDAPAAALFESLGFREVRRYYRMLIELDGPPSEPEWPEGFRVDTFELDDARDFHAALNEAFEEEWNWVPKPFERWYEHRVEGPDFDPSVWWIVRDGEEIAGVLRGEPQRFDAGWVGAIGVLEKWRKRGLGLALLRHAFGEFYRRGQPKIGLGVDAQNPTGATRLYERAGMHVSYEAVAFEKELM